MNRLRCDNSKIKKLLKWKTKYGIDKGLKETINWYSKEENLKFFPNNDYQV